MTTVGSNRRGSSVPSSAPSSPSRLPSDATATDYPLTHIGHRLPKVDRGADHGRIGRFLLGHRRAAASWRYRTPRLRATSHDIQIQPQARALGASVRWPGGCRRRRAIGGRVPRRSGRGAPARSRLAPSGCLRKSATTPATAAAGVIEIAGRADELAVYVDIAGGREHRSLVERAPRHDSRWAAQRSTSPPSFIPQTIMTSSLQRNNRR